MSTRTTSSGRPAALSRTVACLRGWAGFTLIELMIVVAIIAILMAIAYPSYVSYMTKTHRVAAEGCLSEYANYMERYYTTNLSYLDSSGNALSLPTLDCESTSQTGDFYDYTLASSSSTAYVLQATPINGQQQNDTTCGTLTLSQTGARTPTTPDTCW
ncbi:type IV pilin protein [Dyella sp. A6]|uniref:type IV pilin protein n=1 Tax=Dyella aluminiiresistens TaxID=3069105 RepID=UPI002E79D811|nr:type IV pilin protein [Dyella sp. A6]